VFRKALPEKGSETLRSAGKKQIFNAPVKTIPLSGSQQAHIFYATNSDKRNLPIKAFDITSTEKAVEV
jgi:hypothetical protein